MDTLVGLPYPIHESVKVLKQHLYTSLNDEQIKLDERMIKYPLSTQNSENLKKSEQIRDTEELQLPAAEILFSSLLNNLPQYLVSFNT